MALVRVCDLHDLTEWWVEVTATRRFGLDGRSYAVDLCAEHDAALDQVPRRIWPPPAGRSADRPAVPRAALDITGRAPRLPCAQSRSADNRCYVKKNRTGRSRTALTYWPLIPGLANGVLAFGYFSSARRPCTAGAAMPRGRLRRL